MKIYTKSGDKGKTSLVEGTRISKGHLRIDSYGQVDELNAIIGLLSDQEISREIRPLLKSIQDLLFVIGSNLASDPGKRSDKVPPVLAADIELLERALDEMDAELPQLRHFVLPGGHTSVSIAHMARTVCRRAERSVVRLAETEEVPELIPVYLNRLSDYFFVLSRWFSLKLGIPEIKWEPRKQ